MPLRTPSIHPESPSNHERYTTSQAAYRDVHLLSCIPGIISTIEVPTLQPCILEHSWDERRTTLKHRAHLQSPRSTQAVSSVQWAGRRRYHCVFQLITNEQQWCNCSERSVHDGTGAASPAVAESITMNTSRIEDVMELSVSVCGRKLEARDGC